MEKKNIALLLSILASVFFSLFLLLVGFRLTVRTKFVHCTKKFCIKDFFSKCDQVRSFLRIWSHLR